jgi:uncharacterized protein YcaQ
LRIELEDVRWFRLRRSGLVTTFPSPVHAAEALVGVQAQMMPAAGLALFNRCPPMSDSKLDDLLHRSRSLVRIWGPRVTLHLVTKEDWPLMIGYLSRRVAKWEGGSRFGLSSTEYKKALADVEALLERSEGLGRKGLIDAGLRLPEACFNPWGGIYGDLLWRGLSCHIDNVEGESRFAHRRRWLPDLEWSPPSYEKANIELVQRYARTYGPVRQGDLVWWLGAKVGEARQWIGALEEELATVESEGGEAWCLKEDVSILRNEQPPKEGHWPLIMLYRFDPLLLGYRDRNWVVDDAYRELVSRPAGHIEGVVLSPRDGMACATWRYERTSAGITVMVRPFRAMAPALKRGIKARSAVLAEYFGTPLKGVVFDRSWS